MAQLFFFKAPKPRTALPSPRQMNIVNSEVIVSYLRLLATQNKWNGVALTVAKKIINNEVKEQARW